MSDTSASLGDLRNRLSALANGAERRGVDGVIVCPGPDLQYLVGHSVPSHERLSALVVPQRGEPAMVLPALERLGWSGSSLEALGIPIHTWLDGQDPYRVALERLDDGARVLGVDDRMPAVHALMLRDCLPGGELVLAGGSIGELRMRKSAAEQRALRDIGAAIDRVHRRVPTWLRAGRTENEVAADIEAAILAEGHARADFVIVASGPHGASPHHRASDRVIEPGDPVVIDIGGPAPSGYNSDSTRTYLVGGAEPDPEFRRVYDVVRRAQAAGVAAARVGASAESVDAAARSIIADAGYGDHFITRTGHGIGLEVHEDPYIVSGNDRALEAGMAFSVEPGIYLPDRFGVRIEDILIVTEDGPLLCNNAPTELIEVG